MTEFDAAEAFGLLQRKCAELTVTAVAQRIGYSRTSVSLALNGRYPGNLGKLLKRFMAEFGLVACPFLRQEITAETCRGHSGRPYPGQNPALIAHWRTCRLCPHGPGADSSPSERGR